MTQLPLVSQGLLLIQTSRLHSGTTHSVGVLWTSNRPDAETSTSQHTAPTEFEPALPTSEWPQTVAFDRVAAGIDSTLTRKYQSKI